MRSRRRHAFLIHLMAVLVAVQGVIGLVPGAEACLAFATCAHDACEAACDDGAGAGALHRHGDGRVHSHAHHHHRTDRHASSRDRHSSSRDRHSSSCDRDAGAAGAVGRCEHAAAEGRSEGVASAGAIEPVQDACACHLHLGVSDADALPAPMRGIHATLESVTHAFACVLTAIVACDASEAALRPPVEVPDGPPACERSIVATTVLLV